MPPKPTPRTRRAKKKNQSNRAKPPVAQGAWLFANRGLAISTLTDPEFGSITVRRNRLSRSVKLRIDHRGSLSITLPPRTPLFFAKRLVDSSRDYIRRNLVKVTSRHAVLRDGDLIGKTHRLSIIAGPEAGSRLVGTTLQIYLPTELDPTSLEAQQFIKEAALKALRTQAKAYLARQLSSLAEQHGFYYTKLRFSNAGTRWGSCSNKGTISLNIWLMQLPFELIDYVIIHELCHTRAMNHSATFWGHVEAILPNYRELRLRLKQQQPYA